MSYKLWVEKLKAWVEIQKCEYKSLNYQFKFTSYELTLQVRCSNPQVKSSNPWIMHLNQKYKKRQCKCIRKHKLGQPLSLCKSMHFGWPTPPPSSSHELCTYLIDGPFLNQKTQSHSSIVFAEIWIFEKVKLFAKK